MTNEELRLKTLAGFIKLAKSSMPDEELGRRVRAALETMASVEYLTTTIQDVLKRKPRNGKPH
jgi:hypothetical protein